MMLRGGNTVRCVDLGCVSGGQEVGWARKPFQTERAERGRVGRIGDGGGSEFADSSVMVF